FIRSAITTAGQFSPQLHDIATSFIPALCQVREMRIQPAPPMPDLFTILSLLQPTKDGPAAFPHPPGNLPIAEPLPLQINHFIEERSLLAPSLDDFFGRAPWEEAL